MSSSSSPDNKPSTVTVAPLLAKPSVPETSTDTEVSLLPAIPIPDASQPLASLKPRPVIAEDSDLDRQPKPYTGNNEISESSSPSIPVHEPVVMPSEAEEMDVPLNPDMNVSPLYEPEIDTPKNVIFEDKPLNLESTASEQDDETAALKSGDDVYKKSRNHQNDEGMLGLTHIEEGNGFRERNRSVLDSMMQKRSNSDNLQFLDQDTYTLMMVAKKEYGKEWILGILTFIFQQLLGTMALYNQLKTSFGETVFPVHAQASVYVVQFLAIIVSVYIQEDVLNAIRIPVLLRMNGPDPWEETLKIPPNKKTSRHWITHVLIPNLLKFSQGMTVLVASWVVIVQSQDVVELLKDFTALFIISYVDNVLFIIAKRGYFGDKFACTATEAEDLPIIFLNSNAGKQRSKRFLIKSISVHVLTLILLSAWIYVVMGQRNGRYVKMKYPLCFYNENFTKIDVDTTKIGDYICNKEYNTPYCGHDGGDCDEFNTRFPDCTAENPSLISDGICNGGTYNTLECGYDGGDCLQFNQDYPNCIDVVMDPFRINNGVCDKGYYDTSFCEWDGGDCVGLELGKRRPDCNVNNPELLGNGYCDSAYNTLECGFDEGDCDEFNKKYPSCQASEPVKVGDGVCDVTGDFEYDNFFCEFDGGDCENQNFEDRYPGCDISCKSIIGDGICNYQCNSIQCGWDGGDCILKEYPNCHVSMNSKIGDGECLGGVYNTLDCGWDGGDCEEFNALYPNCRVDLPYKIADGKCDEPLCEGADFAVSYNSFECGLDGDDCEEVDASVYPCQYVDGYAHTANACVSGHNIKKYSNKTVNECILLCNAREDCLGVEYGVYHGSDNTDYKPRDCQLSSGFDTKGCPPKFNLDFYKKPLY